MGWVAVLHAEKRESVSHPFSEKPQRDLFELGLLGRMAAVTCFWSLMEEPGHFFCWGDDSSGQGLLGFPVARWGCGEVWPYPITRGKTQSL